MHAIAFSQPVHHLHGLPRFERWERHLRAPEGGATSLTTPLRQQLHLTDPANRAARVPRRLSAKATRASHGKPSPWLVSRFTGRHHKSRMFSSGPKKKERSRKSRKTFWKVVVPPVRSANCLQCDLNSIIDRPKGRSATPLSSARAHASPAPVVRTRCPSDFACMAAVGATSGVMSVSASQATARAVPPSRQANRACLMLNPPWGALQHDDASSGPGSYGPDSPEPEEGDGTDLVEQVASVVCSDKECFSRAMSVGANCNDESELITLFVTAGRGRRRITSPRSIVLRVYE